MSDHAPRLSSSAHLPLSNSSNANASAATNQMSRVSMSSGDQVAFDCLDSTNCKCRTPSLNRRENKRWSAMTRVNCDNGLLCNAKYGCVRLDNRDLLLIVHDWRILSRLLKACCVSRFVDLWFLLCCGVFLFCVLSGSLSVCALSTAACVGVHWLGQCTALATIPGHIEFGRGPA
jgi:hypothetical protein